MNTPLVLTSVALLAGVAARPIDNDRRGGELRELVHSPDHDDRQAFLGRIPSGFDSLNSLQLHDTHDKTSVQAEDDGEGSTSPKLTGADGPSEPDPGLDSPYMGPQRYLASIEQEIETPALSPATPPVQSSPATAKPPKSQPTSGTREPDYSPMVVPLVFASLAALVLLGLAVAVVCVTHLMRRTMLRPEVWQNVTKEKGGVSWSEKEKMDMVNRNLVESGSQGGIAAREVHGGPTSVPTFEATKSSDVSVEDPGLPTLPENLPEISASSTPIARPQNHDRRLGLAFVAWTYDNWVTHFMMALFGWFGVFLGGNGGR